MSRFCFTFWTSKTKPDTPVHSAAVAAQSHFPSGKRCMLGWRDALGVNSQVNGARACIRPSLARTQKPHRPAEGGGVSSGLPSVSGKSWRWPRPGHREAALEGTVAWGPCLQNSAHPLFSSRCLPAQPQDEVGRGRVPFWQWPSSTLCWPSLTVSAGWGGMCPCLALRHKNRTEQGVWNRVTVS